jgi:hypothetical protein
MNWQHIVILNHIVVVIDVMDGIVYQMVIPSILKLVVEKVAIEMVIPYNQLVVVNRIITFPHTLVSISGNA